MSIGYEESMHLLREVIESTTQRRTAEDDRLSDLIQNLEVWHFHVTTDIARAVVRRVGRPDRGVALVRDLQDLIKAGRGEVRLRELADSIVAWSLVGDSNPPKP